MTRTASSRVKAIQVPVTRRHWLASLALAIGLVLMAPALAQAASLGPADVGTVAIAAMLGVVVIVVFLVGLLIRSRLAAQRTRLAAELDHTKLILDTAAGAYFVWDRETGAAAPSAELGRLLGLPAHGVGALDDIASIFVEADRQSLLADGALLRQLGSEFSRVLATDDGRHFVVEGKLAKDREGRLQAQVLWFRDITDESRARARIAEDAARFAEERDRLSALVDAAPGPIWLRDGSLRVVWCNQVYADLLNIDRDVAAPLPELASSAERAPALALARDARQADAVRTQTRNLVVDGARRTYRIVERPLSDADRLVGYGYDVSDMAEIRAELGRHIESHSAVLENLATPVEIYSSDQRLTFFNHAFAHLWRLDSAWLATGPTQGEVLDAMRVNRKLPEQADFRAFREQRMRLFTNLIEPAEELVHMPDGITLRMVITPHPGGGLLYFYEDVSDQLELERARNLLIAVQQATLDNLAEAVAVFGGDGRLKLANPRYGTMWGLDAAFLARHPHISEIADRCRPLVDQGGDWASAKDKMVLSVLDRAAATTRVERPDKVVIDRTSVPLPDGANLRTYLDVTDSIRIERALRERNEALLAADALKSRFLANVSYELRTPLNTVIGFTEILLREYCGTLNEQQRDYTDGIKESSHELLLLIDDILELASIEAGRLELSTEPVDVRELLEATLARTSGVTNKRDLSVRLDCPSDIGEMDADERRVGQALLDLVAATAKLTPPGGRITLGATRTDEEVTMWVESDEQETRPGAAEDPHTALPGHWQAGTDAGDLRLSLAQSFIELHGGRIEIDVEARDRTRITCHLPARRGERAFLRLVANA